VKLIDQSRKARFLTTFEQRLWATVIIPHFMKMTSNVRSNGDHRQNQILSHAEIKVIEKQQAEMWIQKKEIRAEGYKLNADKQALEIREKEFQGAEDLAITCLYRVEMAEAELTQLQENLERSTLEVKPSRNGEDSKPLRAPST
jgi:hypothetical protein